MPVRPVNAQSADDLSPNADLFGFKLYAEEPLGQFELLPCSGPKKSRNKAEGPTQATQPSQMLGIDSIDYHARSQLTFS